VVKELQGKIILTLLFVIARIICDYKHSFDVKDEDYGDDDKVLKQDEPTERLLKLEQCTCRHLIRCVLPGN